MWRGGGLGLEDLLQGRWKGRSSNKKLAAKEVAAAWVRRVNQRERPKQKRRLFGVRKGWIGLWPRRACAQGEGCGRLGVGVVGSLAGVNVEQRRMSRWEPLGQ